MVTGNWIVFDLAVFHLRHHFTPAVGLQQNGGSLVLYLGEEEGDVCNPCSRKELSD